MEQPHQQPQPHIQGRYRSPGDLWDRFWVKVAMPAGDDAVMRCWLWTGAKTKRRGGFGWVAHIREGGRGGGRVLIASRVILEWYKGPPPTPKHEAGHTCPEREESLCVNPGHLEWQTRVENEHFKRRKQRS